MANVKSLQLPPSTEIAFRKPGEIATADQEDSAIVIQYKNAVAEKIFWMQVEAEARSQFYSRNSLFPSIRTDDELEDMPDGEWLIDGVLERGVVAFLVGFTGSCKSFLGIAWAMSVATGRSWLGHATEPHSVLYVAAEGGAGYKKRSRAWKMRHKKSSVDDMHWITDPIQIMNDYHLEGLLDEVRSLDARLVVVDTLSRCFVGFDQQSAKDSGLFFDRLQRIRDAIEPNGTTVVVIHHTGWADKSRSRGSSDFKSSTDAEYVMELADEKDIFSGIKISCTKLKDEESWGSINLTPEKVDVGLDPKGHMKTSLVLVDGPDELVMNKKSDDPRKQDQAWRHNFLKDHDFEPRPYTLTELMDIMNAHRPAHQKVADETLRRDLKQLGWNRSSGARNATLYQRP